jgi:hypothetical protein
MSKLKKPLPKKQATPPKKMGRPTRFTHEIMDRIIIGISNGKTLTFLCEPDDMPGIRTVYDWLESDKELSAHFARARDAGHDVIAEDCLRIADMTALDTTETEQGKEIPNNEWIARSRLRVETRLKLLAKWNPKKYGDKIETQHSGSVDVVIIGGPNSTVDHPDAR